jgi:hypothetical protein
VSFIDFLNPESRKTSACHCRLEVGLLANALSATYRQMAIASFSLSSLAQAPGAPRDLLAWDSMLVYALAWFAASIDLTQLPMEQLEELRAAASGVGHWAVAAAAA